MINSFSNIIYEKPVCIAWIGDYADDLKNYDITNNALDKSKVKILHKIAWDTEKCLPLLVKDFETEKMLLVNWDKKEFINMQEYINKNTQNDWCLHPLPLLTALGNGLGGGDYYGKNQDKIGIWAFDKISFEKQESEKFLLESNFIKKDFEFLEE